MTGAAFTTAVVSTSGYFPEAPAAWSYSSLREIEACPRRWMLSRATYPDIWDGVGYPGLPSVAGLFGDIVHAALEEIVKALVAAGCAATGMAATVSVLRSLGGYTAIVTNAMDARLERLAGNPRVNDELMRRLRVELTRRLPEARGKVQALLTRANLPEHSPTVAPDVEHGETQRSALASGTHAEVALRATDMRFAGRIDLMTLDASGARITDYKTGEPDAAHGDQLRTYALLWALDTEANPTGAPTTELTASYASRLVSFPPPSAEELGSGGTTLRARIEAANGEVASDPPRAVPSDETCRFCQVRHLCEDYWSVVAPSVVDVHAGAWFDVEGVIVAANGTRRWLMDARPNDTRVLLRTPVRTEEIHVGDRVRILGVRRNEDSESGALMADINAMSEMFILRTSY